MTEAPPPGHGRVEALWVKRFHRGPMDAVERAFVRAGRGVVGSADQGGRRQITLLADEGWRAAREEAFGEAAAALDVAAPSARRANVLLSGLDLRDSRERVLRLGGCRVRVLGETRPCERMDEALAGLRLALSPEWRGGVFGEILQDGEIAIGDPAGWEEP